MLDTSKPSDVAITEDAALLEEVVVVGYGKKLFKKEDLTGPFLYVGSKRTEKSSIDKCGSRRSRKGHSEGSTYSKNPVHREYSRIEDSSEEGPAVAHFNNALVNSPACLVYGLIDVDIKLG